MLSLSHSRSKLSRSFATLAPLRVPGRPAAGASPSGRLSRLALALPPVQLRSHISLGLGLGLGLTLTCNMATAASPDGAKPPLKKRSVVSSFLYKFVQEDGQPKAKVALFKRSGQVRTYP